MSGNIKSAVSSGASSISDAASSAWDSTRDAASSAWGQVESGASSAWGQVESGAGSVYDFGRDHSSAIGGTLLGGVAGGPLGSIGSGIGGALGGTQGALAGFAGSQALGAMGTGMAAGGGTLLGSVGLGQGPAPGMPGAGGGMLGGQGGGILGDLLGGGGGMGGDILGGILQGGLGYLGSQDQMDFQEGMMEDMMDVADPYRHRRAGAADDLDALRESPDQIFESRAYQAARDQGQEAVSRQMGSAGMRGSGRHMAALDEAAETRAMDHYGQEFDRLAMLSGATQQPATAAQAGAPFGQAMGEARGSRFDSIGYGLGRIF